MDLEKKVDLIDEKVDYIVNRYLRGSRSSNVIEKARIYVLLMGRIYQDYKISNFDDLIQEIEERDISSKEEINETLRLLDITATNKHDIMNCIISLSQFPIEAFRDYIFKYRERSINQITPESLGKLIAKLLIISNGNVLNGYAGRGYLDLDYCEINEKCKIDGFEILQENISVARALNYILNNRAVYYKEDFMTADLEQEKYDVAIAETPLGMRYNRQNIAMFKLPILETFIRNNSISSPWLSALKIINALKKKGRAVIVSGEGSLFNVLDSDVRKYFVDQGLISRIIKLPSNVYPFSGIPLVLIVIEKGRKSKDIEFCDITNIVETGKRKVNVIKVDKAIKEIENNSQKIMYEEIVENDYQLNANSYLNRELLKVEDGVILEDVAEKIFRGYQITSAQADSMITNDRSIGTYRLLEIGNVDNMGNIDNNNLKLINPGEKDLRRYELEDGDVVLSARGETTKIAVVNLYNNEKMIPNGSLIVIRVNKNKILPEYLKLFLESKKGKLILGTIKTGIVISSINISPLGKMHVKCPSMEKQKEVVNEYRRTYEKYLVARHELENAEQELINITDKI